MASRDVAPTRESANRSASRPGKWLPKPVYEAIPFIYLFSGLGALGSVVFVPEWYWAAPLLLVLGLVSVHSAILILARRRRYRGRTRRASEKRASSK